MKIFPPEFADPQKVRVSQKTATQLSETHGGITYANQIGVPHQWLFSITTPPLDYAACMALFSFSCSLGGRLNACRVTNPFPPLGSGVGDVCTVRTEAQAMSDSVSVTGAPASRSEVLQPGDYIQFSNHSKVYMITAPAGTNGLGQTTLPITPQLRQRVPVGALVQTGRGVGFRMALKTDITKLDLDARGKAMNVVTIELEERIHD